MLPWCPMKRFEEESPAAYILSAEVTERLASPALVIDLARVRRNVDRVLAAVGGAERWRPHVKTTKTPKIWRELCARGVYNFKCATAREARSLAQMLEVEAPGRGDICLAHPAVGPTLKYLAQLARQFPATGFAIISEDPEHVAEIPAELGVFVDVDPGYRRSGLGLDRREEILAVARAAGARFRGVHYYEGNLTNSNFEERRAEAFSGYDALMELLHALEAEGLFCEELITSGTPAFLCAVAYPAFAELGATAHRVSPGTVVLHDTRAESQVPQLELEAAAVVFTRVVSHPGPRRITCDAGSKSVAAEAGMPCAVAIGHPGLSARGPSEEHLPFDVTSGPVPERGTELYLVPRHVCPTVNLAEEAVFMEGERLIGALPIEARSHDTFLDL